MASKFVAHAKRRYSREFASRGRSDVVTWDVVEVRDREKLVLTFEASSSEWPQGVWLATDKGILIEEQTYKSVDLWMSTAPPRVELACLTKTGALSVYNIFRHQGVRMSLTPDAGMIVEDLPNRGRRYRCNDVGYDTRFDKLVFRIDRS